MQKCNLSLNFCAKTYKNFSNKNYFSAKIQIPLRRNWKKYIFCAKIVINFVLIDLPSWGWMGHRWQGRMRLRKNQFVPHCLLAKTNWAHNGLVRWDSRHHFQQFGPERKYANIWLKQYRVSQQVWCLHSNVPNFPPDQNLFYEKFQVV